MTPPPVAQHLGRPGIEPTTAAAGDLRPAQLDSAKTIGMIENFKKSKGPGRFPGPFSHLRCAFPASHPPMTCMHIFGQYLGGKGVCT